MSAQTDFIGGLPPPAPFRDIRNTRPTVASEKAERLLELGRLITTVPGSVKTGGSVEQVRRWKHELGLSKKVAANSRASVNEINSAISRMAAWWR